MSAPRARGRLRPALLSGLVFPGAGQLVNGHRGRALAFGGCSLLVLLVWLQRLWTEILMRLPEDPEARLTALLDPTLPFRMASDVQKANASFFAWTTLALAVLWLGSIVDAWLAARSLPATPRLREE